MNIVIIGGGKVGYYLTKTLMIEHEVVLVEKDRTLCEEISNKLGVMVIHGDGSDLSILESAGASKAAVVVAATGRDQDNLVACQIVNNNFDGVRTIARVNNPKNERVIQQLGADVAVSSTSVISQLIGKEVATEELVTLLTFKRGDMAIVEVEIPKESVTVNQMVKDVSPCLPQNSVLVSILRQGEVVYPRGNTVLKAGDSIIAVTSMDKQVELEKALISNE
ncbi:MAG: potassium channel family protein [Bacillota bacterium]